MARVRTVTVTIPPMLRDLIAELMAGHGNLDVVEELITRDRLEEHLRALSPDLILIGLERNEEDEIGLSLVKSMPNAKVIAISSDARNAFIHCMQPRRTVLPGVSPQALIEHILQS